MLKTILAPVLFIASMSPWLVAQPQENIANKAESQPANPSHKDARYFHLEFVVRELDGKRTISSRNYSMIVVANDLSRSRGSIRAGNRVPIPATSKEAQFTYSDVGINIDCSFAETVGPELALDLTAEISSLSDAPANIAMPPLLRSTRWRSTALVGMEKPTVVFTAQEEKSAHTLEMELTATPLR